MDEDVMIVWFSIRCHVEFRNSVHTAFLNVRRPPFSLFALFLFGVNEWGGFSFSKHALTIYKAMFILLL